MLTRRACCCTTTTPHACGEECVACGGTIVLIGGSVTDSVGTHTLTRISTGVFSTAYIIYTPSGGRLCLDESGDGLGTNTGKYRYTFFCNGDGSVSLNQLFWSALIDDGLGYGTFFIVPLCPDSTTTTIPHASAGENEATDTWTPVSCSPISHSGSLFYTAGTVLSGPPSSYSLTMNQGTTCCALPVHVDGANGLPVSGAVVEIFADHYLINPAQVLGSGTTDAGGDTTCYVYLPGDWYMKVSLARFQIGQFDRTFACDSTTSVTLTVDPIYHAIPGCSYPVTPNIHATHPVFGAIAATWVSGTTWTGSISYSYPGDGGSCGAKTVTVTFSWDGGTGYTESWKTAAGCPDNAGGTTTTATWTTGTRVCPPSFALPVSHTPTAGAEVSMYGSSPMSYSWTE